VPIPPNDADQGFIFNVPPAVVDTLPVAEEFFVSVEPLVARQVPVSDGWIRIETKNHFGFYVAGGTIDPP
jgi:hypothetical protein